MALVGVAVWAKAGAWNWRRSTRHREPTIAQPPCRNVPDEYIEIECVIIDLQSIAMEASRKRYLQANFD
jgi:hypothetical protein